MTTLPGRDATGAAYGAHAVLRDRWTDVFRSDAFIHMVLMASIVASTFQGYLKDRFSGPIPYALGDLFFVAAAVVWFATLALERKPIRGPGIVPATMLVLIALPAIFLLHPTTPLLIELAGLRAWVEFPVGCLIALSIIKSRGQVRAYVGLILMLCILTAVYGILQYRAGPDAAVRAGALAALRHGATLSYQLEGTGLQDFRAFSTFTYPAPFALMMVFGMLLAAGRLATRQTIRRRWLFAVLIPLFFVGMTVSGTRAALVTLALGLGVLAWYRRAGIAQFLLLAVLLAALHVGSLLTSGRALSRWATLLLEEGRLWTYVYAPITIAGRALADSPLGYGLGRTGIGVPFAMVQSRPQGYFVFSDGDLGRAAVEMGLVGILLLACIVLVLIPAAWRTARYLLRTEADDLALGVGSLIIATGVLMLIGSPLAAAPHGIIWWFLLGALLKLGMLANDSASRPGHA